MAPYPNTYGTSQRRSSGGRRAITETTPTYLTS